MTALTVIISFALVVSILLAGIVAALAVHRRLTFLESEYRQIKISSIVESQQIEKSLEQMQKQVDILELRPAPTAATPQLQSINYTQRSQILKMARRGSSAEQIASSFSIPLSHARLLVKLPAMTAPKGPLN